VGLLRDGDGRAHIHTGSSDGFVRRENVPTDGTDDSDSFEKEYKVQTKIYFMGDQAGGRARGKSGREITLYVRSESAPLVTRAYSGDDTAYDGKPTWGPHTLNMRKVAGAVPKTSKMIRPRGLSGKGIGLEIRGRRSVDFEYRGQSLATSAGPARHGRS
jgi:hypothetical protein